MKWVLACDDGAPPAGDSPEVSQLKGVVAMQCDRIEELKGLLGLNIKLHSSLHLTKDQRQMFGMLLAREAVTRDALYTALYGHRPDCDQPGDPKIIDVQLCKLRGALKKHCLKHGLPVVEIGTQWGEYYFMTQDNKTRGRALLDGGNAQ
jgi:DNA-binding response OmpR family regulator